MCQPLCGQPELSHEEGMSIGTSVANGGGLGPVHREPTPGSRGAGGARGERGRRPPPNNLPKVGRAHRHHTPARPPAHTNIQMSRTTKQEQTMKSGGRKLVTSRRAALDIFWSAKTWSQYKYSPSSIHRGVRVVYLSKPFVHIGARCYHLAPHTHAHGAHTHTKQRAPKALNPCRQTEHSAAQ